MKFSLVIIALALTISCCNSKTEITAKKVRPDYYPSNNSWEKLSLRDAGCDKKLFKIMEKRLSTEKQINAVVALRNGYRVYEYYRTGCSFDSIFNIYSCTKTVTGAVAGIAIDQGYIKGVNMPVKNLINDFTKKNPSKYKEEINVSHLLSMTSGLDWPESTKWNHFFRPMIDSGNWIEFVLGRKTEYMPGTVFNYNSGTSHLVSYIIQNCTGQKSALFADKYLFSRIGMRSVNWPDDPQGVSNGAAWIEMSISDAARFGLLYLRDGRWNGEQIISREWVRESTGKQSDGAVYPNGRGGSYGYLWWINEYNGYPVFFAWGAREQYIFVVPDLQLVVVFSSAYNGTPAMTPPEYMREYVITGCR